MKTVLIDTNILLRYFIADIPAQYKKAKSIVERIEDEKLRGKISILAINELIWILENFYELKREVYIRKVLELLALKQIKIIEIKKDVLILVIKKMIKTSLDFTDLYLSEIKQDKEDFLTFDKKLVKFAS